MTVYCSTEALDAKFQKAIKSGACIFFHAGLLVELHFYVMHARH